MIELYHQVCRECSRHITQRYSTSFSAGIRAFDKSLRSPIYAVYGFVRFADEIVDTFHHHDKKALLDRFRADALQAIEERISLNPVLHAFQEVVHRYNIEWELIDAFLVSMEMDLYKTDFTKTEYDTYIYGSAEVVGLMCLRVFVDGNQQEYDRLKASAQSLGSAFQKINFLRDMKSDFDERGRVYFPQVRYQSFTQADKDAIEADIAKDFEHGYEGIMRLPRSARFGVYLAYVYYTRLFKKIKAAPPSRVQEERLRVNDSRKLMLLFSSAVRNSLNLL